MKSISLMRKAFALALLLLLAWLLPLFGGNSAPMIVQAVSTDYPVQLMNLAAKDNSSVLTENGTSDGSSITMQSLGNDLSPSWRFDRVGSDSNGTFFKIVNAESGRLLTPKNYNVSAGADVIVYGSESAQSQHWYVVPVSTDRLGNNLHYKIVNYSNTSLALTQGSSGMTLASYTGADNQLFLLNADGLQGFAGYCSDDNTGSVKAADIGGLFGEVVEVSTFADLKSYAESDTPYTIVVTSNISVTSLTTDSSGRYYCPDGRIYVRSNKTIIGSYAANTLYNVQFCTSSSRGTGNNIIIKNFELQHDSESNGNDSIVVYFGSGQNLWVDHCTFTGHSAYDTASTGLEDWDKFLACCYDADYCTVSDCSFGLHAYGLILGYPADDESSYNSYNNFPRMSIISNKFYQTKTRGPGLMRYGYFHSLNNYVDTFSMAYTVHTACKIYAENCNYANGGNVICDWNSVTYPGSYSESGSVFDSTCGRTVQGADSNATSSACSWRPSSNYSYVSVSGENAKTYCNSYSSRQTSRSNWMYLRYATAGVPSAGYTEAPTGEMTPTAAEFTEGSAYRIKNVNSGLYMQVAGGTAANGTNVQQWSTDSTSVHDIWKLCSAGDGYYYIVSCVGDGGTYVLDVAGKKTADGTNIDIYQYNGGTNQQFMLTQNSDGSYKIRTRVTGEASAVEVADASTDHGANVQQYTINGATCQDWILEEVTDPGCAMDTSVIYTFENVNSGLVMDITDGSMTDNANVQQWGQNDGDYQKWILKTFGSGNYYWIRSFQDTGYALKAESSESGGNIDIVAYSTKDSAQLFRFTKNLDGSYSIITHASKDACLVEVGNASLENGANVQQWEPTAHDCQKWNVTTETTTVETTTEATTTETTTVETTTTTTEATTVETTTETTTTTEPEPEILQGDVNQDGDVTIIDLILLQKWMLRVPDTSLPNWEAGDLCEDGVLNVYDLAALKKILTT